MGEKVARPRRRRRAVAAASEHSSPSLLTSNQRLAAAPNNVALPAAVTGLPKDSVANVSAITSIDRGVLTERTGRVTAAQLDRILAGIGVMLGRA